MDTLDHSRIEKGKRLLLISLSLLAVLRLVLAILLQKIVDETVAFDQFNEVYWWMIPVLALMGAAIYRGGKPVRYIMSGLLVVAVVLEIYLFALAGFPDTTFMLVSILTWITTAFVLYIIMINDETEEFFLYQRSKNFGEYAVVRNSEVQSDDGGNDGNGEDQHQSKTKKEKPVQTNSKKKHSAQSNRFDEEEELEDYLDQDSSEAPSNSKKKKKRKKKDWDDELDLFE